jgi:hypothetical protein
MTETRTAVTLMYITANNFQTEIHVHCSLNCTESSVPGGLDLLTPKINFSP